MMNQKTAEKALVNAVMIGLMNIEITELFFYENLVESLITDYENEQKIFTPVEAQNRNIDIKIPVVI